MSSVLIRLGVVKLSQNMMVDRDPTSVNVADSCWDLKEMRKSACIPSVWAENLLADKPYTPQDYPLLLEAIKFLHKPLRNEPSRQEKIDFLETFFSDNVLLSIFLLN